MIVLFRRPETERQFYYSGTVSSHAKYGCVSPIILISYPVYNANEWRKLSSFPF